MSSARVIDALFERSVDIVQSLPPTGAIQTSYEEKLALYGLYKQGMRNGPLALTGAATEGDVDTRRPGMFDMLGRAKWDAWELQRGYSQQDAKQLYVESLLKILRRFSDRPQAISLMAELEAHSGDVAEQVMNGTLAETASLHSSSVSHSPRAHGAGMPSLDGAASSIAEDLDLVPQLYRPPQAAPLSSHESRTASGSHSHETVTVSDMPRSMSVVHDERTPARRRSAPRHSHASTEKTRAAAARAADDRGRRREERMPTALPPEKPPQRPSARPRAHAARAMPASAASMRSGNGSDLASRSFASAQPSLIGGDHASMAGSVSRSIRSGPMGGYALSVSSVGAAQSRHARMPAPPRARDDRPELDQTLRAIQASLLALTDRLDRAESSLSATEARPNAPQAAPADAASVAIRGTMQATTNTLYDVGALLGIVAPRTADAGPAPSYDAWQRARVAGTGVGPRRENMLQAMLRAPFRFSINAVGLVFRLMLDMTSLAVMASMCIALLRSVSGRGDPWIALRMLGRAGARLSFFTSAANRRAVVRALLASALVGGLAVESGRGGVEY
ncbi:hypothetical protein MSPP1_002815 [Malassezia sp. CBS 17886]|nr:hypothetical protein MSPP1_002815 [Malassezia sp. CBS 17886]